jgi:hypothetical protein
LTKHERLAQQPGILVVLQAVRPKLEMELPYRMYRLVKADGTLCERIEKHPFQMSRQAQPTHTHTLACNDIRSVFT